MTDFIIATLIIAAVMFLGLLISAGNERQRRAIDGIREQAARWAEGDLRLKRAKLTHEIRIENPRLWLEGIANRVLGTHVSLTDLSLWNSDRAKALVATCADGNRLVVTPMPPERFVPAVQVKTKRGLTRRLHQAEESLLGDKPRRVPAYELSVVTAGVFFDLEAQNVWQQVTGEALEAERMYLFEVVR